MLTILSVLRSGGVYDAEWVRKLRDGVARHLPIPHRFVCLSDVEVPCDRIPLVHGWPGWWSKIELFRPGIVTGPAIYFDLDTVIVGDLTPLLSLGHDFSMLRGFGRKHYVGSGVMIFRKPRPDVYERFMKSPEQFITEYADNPHNRHNAFNAARGDQAFIFEVVGDANIQRFTDYVPGMVRLYPRNFDRLSEVPSGCAVVCFKGKTKPPDAAQFKWLRENWA